MKNPNFKLLTTFLLLFPLISISQSYWNTTGGNNITGSEYIGSDGTSTIPLTLRTGTNYPIKFELNGTNEKMRILTSGNVGIGLTTPVNLLDIEGSAAIGATYSGTNTAPTNGLIVEGNVGIGSPSPLQKLDINGNLTISSNQWYGINNARILSNPGTSNIYVGINAYSTSSTGSRNTHLGYNAGNGVSGAADDNTFLGNNTGVRVTTSDYNTFVGSESGSNVTTGHSNTLIGYNSGSTISNGLQNVMIGKDAGLAVNASLNTFVGAFATANGNFQKSGAIGAYAYVEDDKCIVLGAVSGKNGADWTSNVGIGTTAPKQRLHLSTPTSAGTFAQFTNNTTGETSSSGFKIGLTSATDVELRMYLGTRHMQFFTRNNERMRIEDYGNVGINTATSAQKLHVEGTVRITGSDGTSTRILGRDAEGDVSDIVIGSGLSFDTATATLSFSDSGSTAWLLSGNSIGSADFIGTTNNFDFIVKTNNTESMRVTAGGNVGINIASPTVKLQVENSTLVTTGFFNNISGNNSKVALVGQSIGNYTPTGVYGYARTDVGNASPTEWSVIGVKGEASGYSENSVNIGVLGIADTNLTNVYNYGVRGYAKYGTQSTGGYFTAINGVTSNHGIFASYTVSSSTGNDYAGYFSGDIRVNATTYSSDSILKQNIQPLENSLEIISQLRPKKYEFRTSEFPQMNLPSGLNFGLIAQDLENVLPQLVKTALQPAEIDSNGVEIHSSVLHKGINYTSLIPFLIGGIQEQQSQISNLQQQITNQTPADLVPLQNQVQILQDQFNQLQEQLSQCCQATQPNLDPVFRMENPTATATEQAMLLQNAPNPFNQTTSIGFYLPEGTSDAQIQIRSHSGQEVRLYHLAGVGYGKITINGGSLAPGSYFYSLLLNGTVVTTKTMVLSK